MKYLLAAFLFIFSIQTFAAKDDLLQTQEMPSPDIKGTVTPPTHEQKQTVKKAAKKAKKHAEKKNKKHPSN